METLLPVYSRFLSPDAAQYVVCVYKVKFQVSNCSRKEVALRSFGTANLMQNCNFEVTNKMSTEMKIESESCNYDCRV